MSSNLRAADQEAQIRKMEPADLPFLHYFTREAYSLNFHHHWEEGGLEPYLEKVFGLSALAAALADPAIHYYTAFAGETPIAFMKLDLFSNLPGQDPASGIELEKLYTLPASQGKGAGKMLMQKAFQLAEELQKQIFWLRVIDTNREAIAFYERLGFRLHSTTRVSIPGFREERRGLCRMSMTLHPGFPPSV
jgi:diamine N-acetyltransferase